MRHLLGISGKDSLCTAIILKTHNPEIWDDVELFVNDNATELPDKELWLQSCEAYLKKPIHRIKSDLIEIIKKQSPKGNYFLPSARTRYCTRMSKIKPMEDWIGNTPAILYVGLRYDEAHRTGYTPSETLKPEYPLIEHKIDLPKVFVILSALNLLPPGYFWERLYRYVETLINQRNPLFPISLDNTLTTIQKYTLFRGRTRDNCYFCFYQKQSEWVWLLETYPNLFDNAVQMEIESGGFTWTQSGTLHDHIFKRKDEIFHKRALIICKQVESLIFGKPMESDEDLLDTYAGGSCGIFCGK